MKIAFSAMNKTRAVEKLKCDGRCSGQVDGAANSCPSVLGSIPLSEEKKNK